MALKEGGSDILLLGEGLSNAYIIVEKAAIVPQPV